LRTVVERRASSVLVEAGIEDCDIMIAVRKRRNNLVDASWRSSC